MRSYAVMKFTKALNREIEIGGTRLALTLGDAGVSVRVVGTRKPPWEISWPQVMCHLTDSPDVAAAMEKIKNEKPPERAASPEQHIVDQSRDHEPPSGNPTHADMPGSTTDVEG
jgi:hypothetical protein